MEVSPQATEQAFMAVTLQNGTSTATAALGAAELLQSEGGGLDTAQKASSGEGLGNRLDTLA